jgi:hypothetical protein
VPFLKKQLRATDGVEVARLAQLVADLDSNAFTVRQRATRELQRLGELAEPALRQALEKQPALEVRQRVERLLDRLDTGPLPPEQLRALRAIEVLERIGTAEAQHLLEMLASGAVGARTTEEAKNVLRRWPRKQ